MSIAPRQAELPTFQVLVESLDNLERQLNERHRLFQRGKNMPPELRHVTPLVEEALAGCDRIEHMLEFHRSPAHARALTKRIRQLFTLARSADAVPIGRSQQAEQRLRASVIGFNSYLVDLAQHVALEAQRVASRQDEEDFASTFTVQELCDVFEVGSATLHKYAKLAEVPTPERGKRNHQFTDSGARKIARAFIKHGTSKTVSAKCRAFLEKSKTNPMKTA